MEAAIADFDQAIQLRSDVPYWFWERAITYREMGNLEAALADLDHAIEMDVNNADSYVERAITYRAKGELAMSIVDHNKAIELAPGQSRYYFERAVTYKEIGNSEAALVGLTDGIELNPEDGHTYYFRGLFYRDYMNEPDQAVRDFERFLELIDLGNCYECEEADQYIKDQKALRLKISNNSFETDSDSKLPFTATSDWKEYDPDEIQTIEYVTRQAHSGRRSLKIVTAYDQWVDHWVANENVKGWEPGRTYWLSLFVKTTNTPGRLCLHMWTGADNEVEVDCVNATSGWQVMRGTVTLPNDATGFGIYIRTENGTVYVDDVEAGLLIDQ